MLNNGIDDVPDKTIVIFRGIQNDSNSIDKSIIKNILVRPDKKRDWFTSHFYRCLPLTIGNTYGFILKTQFDFAFQWDGGDSLESINFEFFNDEETLNKLYPMITTHFGHGIITIACPFVLRTPPNVNIMTINPPNFILPNITVMTGVVETDNLRTGFTFNLKIQIPNIKVFVPAGTALAAFVPVPRNYCDEFNLIFENEIFNNELIKEELEASYQSDKNKKTVQQNTKSRVDRNYMNGKDVYGNRFFNHQISANTNNPYIIDK